MAAGDAKATAFWGTAQRLYFSIVNASGQPLSGAAGLDSEISKDGGTFADCTNEATEIATASGIYFLDLTATEMEADAVTVIVKSTVGITRTLTVYTEQGTRTRKAQAGAAGSITLDASASASDDFYLDQLVAVVGGTGVGQVRLITDYVGSTKIATVTPNWITNPDATSIFHLIRTARADIAQWLNVTPNALITGRVDATVGEMQAAVVTAAAIATDAITAAKIAADAIGASELAADAVAEIQAGLATAAALATVQADTDDIQTRLPATLSAGKMRSQVEGMDAGTVTPAAVATDAIDADALAASAVAEIQAGLATAAALAAVQADTDNIQTRLPAALVGGKMDSTLSASERDAIANALLDLANAIATGYSVRRALKIAASAGGGKSSGGPANPVFRSLDDLADMITAVANANGDRTSVVHGS